MAPGNRRARQVAVVVAVGNRDVPERGAAEERAREVADGFFEARAQPARAARAGVDQVAHAESDIPPEIAEVRVEFGLHAHVVAELLQADRTVRAAHAGLLAPVDLVAELHLDVAAAHHVETQAAPTHLSAHVLDSRDARQHVLAYDGAPVLVGLRVDGGDLGRPHEVVELQAQVVLADEVELGRQVVGQIFQQDAVERDAQASARCGLDAPVEGFVVAVAGDLAVAFRVGRVPANAEE